MIYDDVSSITTYQNLISDFIFNGLLIHIDLITDEATFDGYCGVMKYKKKTTTEQRQLTMRQIIVDRQGTLDRMFRILPLQHFVLKSVLHTNLLVRSWAGTRFRILEMKCKHS